MRPSDFSIIYLENEFSFINDMPGLPVSQALLCHVEKYFLISPFCYIIANSILTTNFCKHLMVVRTIRLIETILIWQWNFKPFQYPPNMIVNMNAIYTPYHWFLRIHMFNRYTASGTSREDREIQLRLP